MSIVKRKEIDHVDWEAMTLADGYLFAAVMQNKKICRGVIERLLEIKHISHIEYLETEKEIKPGFLSKGVRLDVYVHDEDEAAYNLEMQTRDTKELHKRARYYSSAMDTKIFKVSEDYIDIRNNYVVFICQEDVFNLGRYRYSFENTCTEVEGLKLDDGSHKLFFNTKGYRGEINPKAKAILDFIEGIVSDDPFIKELALEVDNIKNNE